MKLFLKLLLAALVVLSVLSPMGPSAEADLTLPDRASALRTTLALDTYVRPLVDAGHLSGQLLVVKNGVVLAEKCWGYADIEEAVPVTPETRFNIASVTKPMTVFVAYNLIQRKSIGYTDPISRWLPDFPMADSITVEHLLRHRSGIPHEIVPDSLATEPRTAKKMVELAKKLPLDFPPGSKSQYSSGGFTVLARILEIASDSTYAQLVESHLFRPLGMTASLHTENQQALPGRALPYVPTLAGIDNAPYQDLSGLVGAGSIWSNARDLHRFVDAVVSGRLGPSMKLSYVRNGKLSFNGRTSGYQAYAEWDSTTGIETIFAGNVATGASALLKTAVPRIVAGENLPAAQLPALGTSSMSPAELTRYEGTFKLESGVRLVLRVRNGSLYANDWILVPAADGSFFSPRDYGVIMPVEGAEGRIERLDWRQGDQVYPAPRVN